MGITAEIYEAIGPRKGEKYIIYILELMLQKKPPKTVLIVALRLILDIMEKQIRGHKP